MSTIFNSVATVLNAVGQDLGVTECIVGFRDTYKGEQDTKTVAQKIAMLQWFADNIIAKTASV